MTLTSIRPLTAADEALLWKIFYHAIHPSPGDKDISAIPELARYVAGWMQPPTDMGFAAECAGTLVGAAWLRCWNNDERGYGFVDEAVPELSMAMLPGHRGQGIGTKLLQRVLEAASQRFPAVSLSVTTSNPARRLYGRFGFADVGEPEGDSIVMLRRF